MSSAPVTKEELEFALKVRRALDERAASLPAATTERLAAARRAALARKKPDAAIVLVPALAGSAGTLELRPPDEPRRQSLARRLARAWPLALLLAGLVGIAYWEDMQRTAELADIDAAMLSDNLPLNAYLDHGFNAYLSHTH
ncbi:MULTISPECIES: DUF3619 family protein [Burkholderia]|uniref:DUF3619 family protein n=1 Tax=Burkholderia savannae TaxID=1637837 RepID=A0ABR5TFH9_9BURK|nr:MULTISPECIES: DUF3619 family protein [Burkholderia]AOJ69489.1 hypothetical protein WS78_12530 [Burkholderia savannae]AOJ81404.1 hypothetical protein WS86_12845 [Burkholderia savannae]AOK47610.1 hypothetical protein WT60_12715 [Burkholderia sp. MSMB617WGS]KGS02951.1 hypothetical protein X946_3264 [Burkholderia sp. ABCPW 111]KVG41852.1 hypothetical protein WS77_16535 [Burkholderia sp. MSMB0265]